MNCSRRLYKGNAYEICLPLVSGATLVRFYTSGDVILEKEPEITGDSMCFSFTEEDLASLEDGVLRYQVVTDYETIDTNSPYVVVTPGDYSGRTLDDIIQDAYDSGYTDGQEACTGGTCEGVYESGYTDGYADGYEVGYESGYTDGYAACESGDTGDTPTAATKFNATYQTTSYITNKGYLSFIMNAAGLGIISKVEENGVEIPIETDSQGNFYHYFATHGPHTLDLYLADPETTEIPSLAFGYDRPYEHTMGTSLISITIPEGITSIGSNCFEGCAYLTTVNLPATLTSLGSECFNYCRNLSNVVLPEALTTLNSYIFDNCSSLTGMTIPGNVTLMSAGIFRGCSSLEEIVFDGIVPPAKPSPYTADQIGPTGGDLQVIYVPCESVQTYREAFTNYANIITCNA